MLNNIIFGTTVAATLIAVGALAMNSVHRLQSRIFTQGANEANALGYFPKGVELAKLAIAKDPTNGYAYYYAGLNKIGDAKPSEALSFLKQAEPLMPHLPTLLRVRGQANYGAGNFEDSAQDLQRYLALEPIPISAPGAAYFLCGQALYRAGQYGKAGLMMQDAEKYDEFSTRSLQTRLMSSLLLNEPKFAQYLFRKYQLRSNNIGKTSFNDIFTPNMALMKPEIFLEFTNAVRAYIPDNDSAQRSMALAHAKLGHESEARSIVNTLYLKFPENNDILLTDADVCTLLGDTGGAKNAYRKYLENVPDTPLRKQIELNMSELK